MDLTEALSGVRFGGYQHDLGRDQPAQLHLSDVRRRLPTLVPPGMRVLVSGSGQSLPVVPWIAVVNRDVTTTAQEGLYVVYLYRRDLSRIFLSMNQGATQHQRNAVAEGLRGTAAEKAALAELARESSLLRERLTTEALTGLATKIELAAPSKYFLPRGYEEGNIAAIEYIAEHLPDEDALRGDLDRMLALYATCVNIKNEIRTTEPGVLKTTANSERSKPKFKQKPPAFRPKSSAEYRAHVAEQQQDKQRRHEDLLNVFAEWVKAVGLVAANNVHPCDLTVDDGDGSHWLIEAKTVGANAEHAVREAIGQLFAYRHFYYRDLGRPAPALVALFSEPIGEGLAELLVSLNIEAIWRSRGNWHGQAPAGSANLLAAGSVTGHVVVGSKG